MMNELKKYVFTLLKSSGVSIEKDHLNLLNVEVKNNRIVVKIGDKFQLCDIESDLEISYFGDSVEPVYYSKKLHNFIQKRFVDNQFTNLKDSIHNIIEEFFTTPNYVSIKQLELNRKLVLSEYLIKRAALIDEFIHKCLTIERDRLKVIISKLDDDLPEYIKIDEKIMDLEVLLERYYDNDISISIEYAEHYNKLDTENIFNRHFKLILTDDSEVELGDYIEVDYKIESLFRRYNKSLSKIFENSSNRTFNIGDEIKNFYINWKKYVIRIIKAIVEFYDLDLNIDNASNWEMPADRYISYQDTYQLIMTPALIEIKYNEFRFLSGYFNGRLLDTELDKLYEFLNKLENLVSNRMTSLLDEESDSELDYSRSL
jgi:hypothetical protein